MIRDIPEELQERLYVVDDRIVVFRQFAHPTPENFLRVAEHIEILVRQMSPCCLVTDLSEIASRPSAAMRALAYRRMEELKPLLLFIAGVTGGALFRKIMLKFVLEFSFRKPHQICTTTDEGIKACQEFLALQSGMHHSKIIPK